MPYVQRDENGKVNGVARWLTEGVAEEFLENDSQEVTAYLSAMGFTEEQKGAFLSAESSMDK